MHGYDIPSHDRKLAYYIVGIVASLAGICIGWIISTVSAYGLPVAAPSGVAIFGLAFLIFDKWVWRWKFLYSAGIIPIPDLAGTWTVALKNSTDEQSISASMEIHQTYTRLKVRLNTNSSESISQMAFLTVVDPKCYKLRYEYLAEYSPPQGTVSRHYGVTSFTVTSDTASFKGPYKGDYYTEQGRDTNGSVQIKR